MSQKFPASSRNDIDPRTLKIGPIEYRPIDSLVVYERNARKHPGAQIEKLRSSICEYGFIMPVLIDENLTVIVGEARLIAARLAGLTEVPTISIAHLSPAQVRAYRLADNKLATLATWDDEILALEIAELIEISEFSIEASGFETAELDLLLDGAPAAATDPADELPELPTDPVSAPGHLWVLGGHRLMCGSSLETAVWMQLMDGATGRMMFADPPYNVAVNGHVSGLGKVRHDEFAMASGEMSEGEFIAFLQNFLEQSLAHLADGAVLDVCIDWRHLFELLSAARKPGLTPLNLCVWNKSNAGMGSLYRSKHELVLVFKKGRAPHTNNVELGKHGRYRTNVWDFAGANSFSATRMDDLNSHPTVKPVALVAEAIRDVTRHGEIVIDPFMGSGTTILAAERTKRRAYGLEIEPRYVDVAIRRWEAMTGKAAVLAESGESFAAVAARRAADDRNLEAAAA